MPLHVTAQSEAVAGVRFKACATAAWLASHHPGTSALTIEIWDGWRKRSLGGCTYRVAHPGGRNSEIFPVNANEAEAAGWPGSSPLASRGGVRKPPGRNPIRISPILWTCAGELES